MTVTHRATTGTGLAGSAGSKEKIRIGVLGTGFGSAVHIPALKHLPETEVVAVYSRRADRAREVALQHGIDTYVTDFRELVRDPAVDAVIVATPPHTHHQVSLAALEARKHVLCEKPMAGSLAEARDMVKMAASAGVVAMINHELRFVPVRARIKELIDEGYIGEPQAAIMTVIRSGLADPHGRPFGWLMEQEKAGGMLGAIGSHYIDGLRWWFGEITGVGGATATMVKRRRVAESSSMATVDADDNFAFVVRFANGALATVHVTATAPIEAGEEITLTGTDGVLMVRDGRLLGGRRQEGMIADLPIPDRLTGGVPDFEHTLTRPTVLLLREWISAIQTGTPASPSFADGAKVQEVLDGVARSGHHGRWIDTGQTRWPMGARSTRA